MLRLSQENMVRHALRDSRHWMRLRAQNVLQRGLTKTYDAYATTPANKVGTIREDHSLTTLGLVGMSRTRGRKTATRKLADQWIKDYFVALDIYTRLQILERSAPNISGEYRGAAFRCGARCG